MNLLNWDFADKLSIVLGIITSIITILILIQTSLIERRSRVRRRSLEPTQNYQEAFESLRGITSPHPKALVLSLTGNRASIAPAVKRWLKENDLDMPLVEVVRDEKLTERSAIESFINELRGKVRSELDQANTTEIHLFVDGPVAAAALAGAILDNWGPVKLYQYNTLDGIYSYWGPLVKT